MASSRGILGRPRKGMLIVNRPVVGMARSRAVPLVAFSLPSSSLCVGGGGGRLVLDDDWRLSGSVGVGSEMRGGALEDENHRLTGGAGGRTGSCVICCGGELSTMG